MKKHRFKLIMRGIRMGLDPMMAFRSRSSAVRYRGIDESLIRDWYSVGGDMRAAVKQYEHETGVVGRRVSSRA
jgi:hypothetical protein